MKPETLSLGVYVCSATAILGTLMGRHWGWSDYLQSPVLSTAGTEHSWPTLACFLSLVMFVFASAVIPYSARLAHILGLAAGLLTAAWLISTEFVWFQMFNTWIALNVSGSEVLYGKGLRPLMELRILTVALIVVAIVLSALRLIPTRWTLRKRPVCERTWPAFAASAIILAVWFVAAVSPYRLPGIVDPGVGPDFRILHVVKRGMQFHEVTVSTFRNSFSISRNDRRLLDYAIEWRSSHGKLPAATLQKLALLSQLPELKDKRTPPPKALRAWNAEGWYYLDERTNGIGLRSFSGEFGTTPPKELIDIFREIEAIFPTQDAERYSTNDICFGFCYDPVAALGYIYANDRCFTRDDGKTRCQ